MPDAEMTATVKATMSGMRGSLSSTPAIAQGERGGDYGDIISAIGELQEAILRMKVVLDSGEAIGIVDDGLGRNARREAWQ